MDKICISCGEPHDLRAKRLCEKCSQESTIRYFANKRKYWQDHRLKEKFEKRTMPKFAAALDVLWAGRTPAGQGDS